MSNYVTVCEAAARAGGAVLRDWLGRFKVREKGPSDLVTEADVASQTAIKTLVMGHFPQHGFVAEEDTEISSETHEFCWIVDPLDGTTNYVHQVPHYCVSVALVHKGRPIAGAIYEPLNGECFTAAAGEGVWLDGQPIRTSEVTELSQALVAASFSAKVERGSPEIDQFQAALLACQAVRRTGSAALNLAYVAAGRFDGFWAMSTKVWDVAAGVLMVQEAGGMVTDIDGAEFDLRRPHPVATSQAKLHEPFRRLLNPPSPRG
jgi:myo-inositol-1(or 4)-monophosphatase